MRVTLTLQKVDKITGACTSLLNKRMRVSIRDVCRVIGLLVSNFMGLCLAPYIIGLWKRISPSP